MATTTFSTADYDALVAERDALAKLLKTVTVERDLLKERLTAHLRQLFAAKSEVRGTDQKDLFFNEAEALAPAGTPVAEEVTAEIEIPAHTRKKRGRKPLDPNLPREIVRHELPESERLCGHDGTALVEIGVEISEQLEIIPQQVRVIQHQRVKYACPCCDGSIKVTPAPARIIPKGLLTPSALAWVVTSKYMDALPLYRQAALLGRFGGDLSRSTLAASIIKVGEAMPTSSMRTRRRSRYSRSQGRRRNRRVTCGPRSLAAGRRSGCSAMRLDEGPPMPTFCLPASNPVQR